MCGIAGIVAFNRSADVFLSKLEKSISTLGKRGPDHTGTFVHDKVALAHTRLSVIDVSEQASQPFTDQSGRYTIVYNGEIYNYRELWENLTRKGFVFRSQSDTEVLLNLYILEGESFLNKLNGFFAFAIYDKVEKSLFIARDRMGMKPLLIYRDEEKFIFASEMKALLSFDTPKELDYVSLFQYLQLNYIPSPNSIFNNVKKLRAGHYLVIKDKTIQEIKYYQIPYDEKHLSCDSYDIAKNKLHDLLEKSVQRRLIADVPLGAFLSGGIDSSIIVALASRFTNRLNTFSIGFADEPMFDETRYSQLIADRYKTNHTTFRLTNDDLFSVLHDVLDYTDEPFADSSALAVYILSKHTRKHVTVALSGDGADEMFGGYNKHFAELKARNAGITEQLAQLTLPLWNKLPQSRNSFISNKMRQLNRFIEGISLSPSDRYWLWCGFVNEKEAENILNNKINTDEYFKRKTELTKFINSANGLNDFLYSDMHLVLQNDMLVKVDMMSMANSLEVREPFLDYELVNYTFSLPSDYKIDKHSQKKILKESFKSDLPEEIYHRSKHGFEVPLLKWFQTELKSMITDDLLSKEFIEAQQIFHYPEIEKLKARLFSSNPKDVVAQIWGLIVFQYSWKKYF